MATNFIAVPDAAPYAGHSGPTSVLTGPEDLRARFTGHTVAALVAELASLRPRPGSTVGYATRRPRVAPEVSGATRYLAAAHLAGIPAHAPRSFVSGQDRKG